MEGLETNLIVELIALSRRLPDTAFTVHSQEIKIAIGPGTALELCTVADMADNCSSNHSHRPDRYPSQRQSFLSTTGMVRTCRQNQIDLSVR